MKQEETEGDRWKEIESEADTDRESQRDTDRREKERGGRRQGRRGGRACTGPAALRPLLAASRGSTISAVLSAVRATFSALSGDSLFALKPGAELTCARSSGGASTSCAGSGADFSQDPCRGP